MLELDNKSKIIKKTINDYTNMFLAASWVRWTESLQPITYLFTNSLKK